MLKVGLTGSIAVGKSFVSECLREAGCRVLDADSTARDVVAPKTAGLAAIVSRFGSEILTQNGQLDRAKLGAIVFADEDKRKLLNSIVHPLVFDAQKIWLKAVETEDPNGIAVVDAALMIESGGYKRFSKIIVVWCEPEIQLKRLMARDKLDASDAIRRIDSQMPQDEKKRFADFLIDTSSDFESTRRQANRVVQELRRTAQISDDD